MALPNGTGRRRWLDRIANEGVRLAFVIISVLGAAYLALGRDLSSHIMRSQTDCQALEQIRQNQGSILLAQLALIDTLADRTKAELREIPADLRSTTLAALANLPDEFNC